MGWHVFPLEPRSKRPWQGTRGHLDASCSEAQIRAWWTQQPESNVGISLAPSGLVVLDVDVGEGKRGYEALRTLATQLPDSVPATAIARTGGGGQHYIFSRPAGVPAKRKIDFLHRILPAEGKGSGLDLLGDGYIVAAPSIHESGHAYQWEQYVQPAPLPRSLSNAYTASAETITPEQAADGQIGEGGRDNALYRLAASLREQNLSEQAICVALAIENGLRCNPPLPDSDISRIAHSACQRVVPDRDVMANATIASALGLPADATSAPVPVEEGRISAPLSALGAHEWPPVRMYPTGMPALDAALGGGFCTRGLSVLIGPPGSGKSSLAIGLCLASEAPALYFSTELEAQEIIARIAAQELQIPWLQILKGLVPREQVQAALAKYPQVRVVGKDMLPRETSAAQLMQAIVNEIFYTSQEFGRPPLVVIDYLQDLTRMSEDRREAVGQLAKLSRIAAPMLDVPLVALSSTGRAWYGSHPEIEHPAAFLSAAKESGDIDFDASNVLYLDVLEDASAGHRDARIAIAKCRHGTTSFVGARYHGAAGGTWRENSDALEAFKPEVAEQRQRAGTSASDRAAVLAAAAKGGDPKGVLKHNCGIPQSRADRTISELLQEGVLIMAQEQRVGADQRPRTVTVVKTKVI